MTTDSDPTQVDETSSASVGTTDEAGVAAPPMMDVIPTNPAFKWYVVHTHSGFENHARTALLKRVKQSDMQDKFGEVLVPSENVVEVTKTGTKRRLQKKFFPSYMIVQMELTEQTWHIVKDTPKITGFVGNQSKPPSIPEAEVRKLTQQIDEGTLQTKPKLVFSEGETVRVTDGNFDNFTGTIEAVNEEKSKVRVLIQIFGRPTPVELDFTQVEKV